MLRLFLVLIFPLSVLPQSRRFEFSAIKMGSSFSIIFYHTDSAEARSIAQDCFAIVDSLDAVFSDYSSESEVGRLNQAGEYDRYHSSPELFTMILLANKAWRQSAHSFDITIGALSQLWRQANKNRQFPETPAISLARESTGFQNLAIDTRNRTITLKKKGVRLDFGGIVPGYAAQRVVDYLHSRHIHQALADASGDIVVSDAPPGKTGWMIGVNLPESENEIWDKNLVLSNCAVSTSGDVYRYTLHEGKKYSHIIDPRTGYGMTSQRNVTIIAKDGATADWMATACSVLSIKQAMALANRQHAGLLIATLEEKVVRTYSNSYFDKKFQKKLP